MRKLFTLATAVMASISLWAAPYYVISGKCNVPLAKGMSGAKYQILKVDGETVEATEEISSSITATASLYYNSTSIALEDLTTASNYGPSSSSNRTMQGIKLPKNEEMEITLNDKAIEKIDVIYLCGSSDPCSLVIAGEEQSTNDQNVHIYSEVASFSGSIKIQNTSNKEYRLFIVLTISDEAPSTDPVSVVTIEGPTSCYVGQTVEFTMSTDVRATEYQWAVNDVEQEGATKKTFSFKPEELGIYQITGQARNNYNEAGAWSSAAVSLEVTEKPAPVPCAQLIPAAEGDTPAEGAKVALAAGSYGGNIIFAGAREGNYAASFQYNEYGLQMCKGGADSVRVELGFNLKVGSIIELQVNQNGLDGKKARGFKLLAPGQKTVLTATWQQEDASDLEKIFIYEVKEGDKLAGQNKFGIGRSESAILHAVIVSDCGEEILPDTDPVTAATIAGATEGFVGQTIKLTCTAEHATTYQWCDANGAIAGAINANYNFTPEAAGEYSFYCLASNDYTAEPVRSNTLIINIAAAIEQVSVSATTEWDWTKAASVAQIKLDGNSSPKQNERCLLATISGMNNNEDFNSQALLFEGEYPVRDGSYCQGRLLQFTTTVPGFVSVEYSNTGNRDEGQDLERILTINGTKVGAGALRSDTRVAENNIAIEAGDVAISSVLKSDESVQYIRIYKVIFSTEEIETGLEEIDATVKAVKVIHNGQLLIKRGDVLYNAQGTIIR